MKALFGQRLTVALGVTGIILSAASLSLADAVERNATKGHARLLMRTAPASVPTEKVAACPGCRNQFAKRVDWTARGAQKPTVLVPRHLCDGCSSTTQTVGHGKQKQILTTHTCTVAQDEGLACCTRGPQQKRAGAEQDKI